VAQASSPLLTGLRDAVLRLTPGAVAAAEMRRVQRWVPPDPHPAAGAPHPAP